MENVKVNRSFNRVQTEIDNLYISTYGSKSDMSHCHFGQVKCKLLHSQDDSVVFPDQIFIEINKDEFKWIQPLTFLVNLLVQEEDIIHCGFFVDISAGNTLKIEFTNEDLITKYEDHSSLFNCKIFGPKNLLDYSTGSGKFIDDIPHIKLYHHTLPRSKKSILKSSKLRLSQWNIQGTKELSNVGYFYLTCLDNIKVNSDLQQIGMSTDGVIRLLLDNYPQPKFLSPNPIERIKQGILELKVYRESTKNRKATLGFFVDCSIIAPKHLWKHYPTSQVVYYEICMPFIYRIGGLAGESFSFKNSTISNQENVKIHDYQVVGIGTTFKGLEAPYDEENTEYIFKIEPLDSDMNILEFWFENTNSDQYNNKIIEVQEFEDE